MNNTNCQNCGAPIKGYKCEYCGTEYNFENRFENSLEEPRETMIWKLNGNLIRMKLPSRIMP